MFLAARISWNLARFRPYTRNAVAIAVMKKVIPMAKFPTESVGHPATNAPDVQPPPIIAPKERRKPAPVVTATRLAVEDPMTSLHIGVTADVAETRARRAAIKAPGTRPTMRAARQAVIGERSDRLELVAERRRDVGQERRDPACDPQVLPLRRRQDDQAAEEHTARNPPHLPEDPIVETRFGNASRLSPRAGGIEPVGQSHHDEQEDTERKSDRGEWNVQDERKRRALRRAKTPMPSSPGKEGRTRTSPPGGRSRRPSRSSAPRPTGPRRCRVRTPPLPSPRRRERRPGDGPGPVGVHAGVTGTLHAAARP